jgi:hypothetical protein
VLSYLFALALQLFLAAFLFGFFRFHFSVL